jgi:hypothetical protein
VGRVTGDGGIHGVRQHHRARLGVLVQTAKQPAAGRPAARHAQVPAQQQDRVKPGLVGQWAGQIRQPDVVDATALNARALGSTRGTAAEILAAGMPIGSP